jgi:hypothetical protein
VIGKIIVSPIAKIGALPGYFCPIAQINAERNENSKVRDYIF